MNPQSDERAIINKSAKMKRKIDLQSMVNALKEEGKFSEATELIRLDREEEKAGLTGDLEFEMTEIIEEMEATKLMTEVEGKKWDVVTLNGREVFGKPVHSVPIEIVQFLNKHGKKVINGDSVFLLSQDWVYCLNRKWFLSPKNRAVADSDRNSSNPGSRRKLRDVVANPGHIDIETSFRHEYGSDVKKFLANSSGWKMDQFGSEVLTSNEVPKLVSEFIEAHQKPVPGYQKPEVIRYRDSTYDYMVTIQGDVVRDRITVGEIVSKIVPIIVYEANPSEPDPSRDNVGQTRESSYTDSTSNIPSDNK